MPDTSRLRDRLQALRQGRRLRRAGHAGQAPEGQPPGALLLDGGDTWQGSATSLWTNAQDMVDACKLLGVDVMTGHWEFTYGMERVKEIVEKGLSKARSTSSRRTSRPPTSATRCSSPTSSRPSTACRWPSSARPSLHADRQPALHGGRLELRHPGRQPAEDGRRGARQGRAGGGGAVAQRHGRRPQDGLARARRRRHPRRPHARRHAGAGAGEERRRHDHRHQRRQQQQVSRRDRLRGEGRQGGRLPLRCCRYSPSRSSRTRRWPR